MKGLFCNNSNYRGLLKHKLSWEWPRQKMQLKIPVNIFIRRLSKTSLFTNLQHPCTESLTLHFLTIQDRVDYLIKTEIVAGFHIYVRTSVGENRKIQLILRSKKSSLHFMLPLSGQKREPSSQLILCGTAWLGKIIQKYVQFTLIAVFASLVASPGPPLRHPQSSHL